MICHAPSYSIYPSLFESLESLSFFAFPLLPILKFSVSVCFLAFSLHVQTTVAVFLDYIKKDNREIDCEKWKWMDLPVLVLAVMRHEFPVPESLKRS
jgi:hypothetical protein